MKVERQLNTIKVFIYDKNIINKVNNILEYVISTINKNYNININKYNDIKIYKNKEYGIIIEIYINNNYNVKVLNNVLLLYEVDDPLDYLNDEIYFFNNKYYINFKKVNIDILEKTNIIYGNDVYKIIGKGIKLT